MFFNEKDETKTNDTNETTVKNEQGSRQQRHKRRESAVLSMPNLFRATFLDYTSPVTKFATYIVEEQESETGDEFLMKAIKTEKCVAMLLKFEFDKLKTLEHPNLPNITFSEPGPHYSYIVFEKPKGKPVLESNLPYYKECYCRQIIYQLAKVLQYTHAYGIVHRDLRPSNVFVHSLHQKQKQKQKQKHTSNKLLQLHVTLMDFGATKMLKADDRLAILEGGSGFISSYVRHEWKQYPAPEILMDLRYQSMVDAWFVGGLMYLLISKGKRIPFEQNNVETNKTENEKELDQELELELDQELELELELDHEETMNAVIQKHILQNKMSFVNDEWLNISADLEQLCQGLLLRDPKLRFTVDHILWSPWIQKYSYDYQLHCILSNWIRIHLSNLDLDLDLDLESQRTPQIRNNLIDTSMFGLCIPQITDSTPANANANAKAQQKAEEFKKWNSLISVSNKHTTILHQFKLCNYNDAQAPSMKSDCFITVCSNIWLRYGRTNPIEFEFHIAYAQSDIYLGLVSDRYKLPNNYYHYIGCNNQSLGVSLRTAKVYRNSQQIACVARNDYNAVHKFYSLEKQLQPHHKNKNKNKNKNKKNKPETAAQLLYNIQQTGEGDFLTEQEQQANKMKNADRELLMNNNDRCAMRNVRVRMRVDCTSRTLSLLVNGQVLNPIYFEFLSYVTPAVTLCHCLDQISLCNVTIDKTVQ